MHRDRIEELIMVVVGIGLLVFLAPQELTRDLSTLVLLAMLLILLLVVRGYSWHEERITPYDGLLVLGIFFTVVYLLSFMPLQRVPLTGMTVTVFAAFYIVMAVLLARHRGVLFNAPHTSAVQATRNAYAPTLPSAYVSHYSVTTDSARSHLDLHQSAPRRLRSGVFRGETSMRGSEAHVHSTRNRAVTVPVRHSLFTHARRSASGHSAIVNDSGAEKRSFLRRIFRRDRAHDPAFRKGIEPIHEMTREEIVQHAKQHRIEVYHESPKSELLVALPGSNTYHDESCDRLRSTRPGMRLFLNRKSSMLKKMVPCPKCKPSWP